MSFYMNIVVRKVFLGPQKQKEKKEKKIFENYMMISKFRSSPTMSSL